MTEQYLIQWLVTFLCGGVVSMVSSAVAAHRHKNKRDKALENGVQCLLRAEIIRQYEKWMERGLCPLYAKEALRREYDAYHALHGNDVATGLYRQVMSLPTESRQEREGQI